VDDDAREEFAEQAWQDRLKATDALKSLGYNDHQANRLLLPNRVKVARALRGCCQFVFPEESVLNAAEAQHIFYLRLVLTQGSVDFRIDDKEADAIWARYTLGGCRPLDVEDIMDMRGEGDLRETGDLNGW